MEKKCKYLLEHKVWDDYLGAMVTSYYCGAEKEPSPCDHVFTPSNCEILYPPIKCPHCGATDIESAVFDGDEDKKIYIAGCGNCYTRFHYYRDGKKVWYHFL